ncbi:MAG TPA: hypothetical protein VK892_15960 [Pyrinomonadaceae bacterium]|nr:hypothetical protein [Pyrinomonadaceae bacterium]
MSFDWDAYKDLAEELRHREDEASKRSAISRLYYSVYWKARNLLEKEEPNLSVPPDNAHTFVWRKFLGKGITRKTVYKDGTRLKEYRKDADYEPGIENLAEAVEASFIIAERILKTLNSLSGKM